MSASQLDGSGDSDPPPLLLDSSGTPSQVDCGEGGKVGPATGGGGPIRENRKWSELFCSKLKGIPVSLVAHSIDSSFGRCSVFDPRRVV